MYQLHWEQPHVRYEDRLAQVVVQSSSAAEIHVVAGSIRGGALPARNLLHRASSPLPAVAQFVRDRWSLAHLQVRLRRRRRRSTAAFDRPGTLSGARLITGSMLPVDGALVRESDVSYALPGLDGELPFQNPGRAIACL